MASGTLAVDEIHLPADVWLEIVLDTQPLDVIALSQTCRAMHTVLSTKPVWMDILRNLMSKYGRFVVPFCHEDMALQTLQKAATCSQRWKRLKDRSAILPEKPLPAVQLQPKLVKEWQDAPRQTMAGNCYLTPGGRFLITSQLDAAPPQDGLPKWKACIVLWDMGSPFSATGDQPMRIATHVLAYRSQRRSLIVRLDACLVNNVELRVAVSWGSCSRNKSSAVVLKIFLEVPNPKFEVLGAIKCDNARWYQAVKIQGDRLLITHLLGNHPDDSKLALLLWDYRRSLVCQWCISIYSGLIVDAAYRLTQDYVLALDSTGIYAWDIGLLGMVPASAKALDRRTTIHAHWKLMKPWPFSRVGVRPPTRIPNLGPEGDNAILFQVEHRENIVAYRFTLTKWSNSYHSTLVPLYAGYLPKGLTFQPQPSHCSTGVCSARPVGIDGCISSLYAYCPPETDISNLRSRAVGEAAMITPIGLVFLGEGQVVDACAFSGRVIYEIFRDGQNYVMLAAKQHIAIAGDNGKHWSGLYNYAIEGEDTE
ncbi:hypothetical protein NMY22_g18872 [Coprinellus aureogranulatus]|nr:hypothetical protein NMY22_g18872 [Coprinellus aureogranulatus]